MNDIGNKAAEYCIVVDHVMLADLVDKQRRIDARGGKRRCAACGST